MSSNGQGTTQGGRIARACAILLPLLAAAAKLLPEGGPVGDAADLLGQGATTLLANLLAIMSLARAILGARRSAVVSEWLLRSLFGERIARRLRGGPSLADLIVSAWQRPRVRVGARTSGAGRIGRSSLCSAAPGAGRAATGN